MFGRLCTVRRLLAPQVCQRTLFGSTGQMIDPVYADIYHGNAEDLQENHVCQSSIAIGTVMLPWLVYRDLVCETMNDEV
jgi:hypothetical protein